jgi:hypothetical protein
MIDVTYWGERSKGKIKVEKHPLIDNTNVVSVDEVRLLLTNEQLDKLYEAIRCYVFDIDEPLGVPEKEEPQVMYRGDEEVTF